jgi:hypothetical protein
MGTGSWSWPPTPSNAEVKERVDLYLYSPYGASWPVLGWTFTFNFIITGQTFTAFKVSRHCALVLPENVAWEEVTALGSDEGTVLAVDFWARQCQKGAEHLGWILYLEGCIKTEFWSRWEGCVVTKSFMLMSGDGRTRSAAVLTA